MPRFVCMIALALLCSCSPAAVTKQEFLTSDPRLFSRCGKPFVTEPWLFVHKIEASLPMGKSVTMIGATKVDPVQMTLQGVLMTIEGFVLFDGIWQNGKLTVLRALPPFDRPAFADNMMNDMRLLFLVPQPAAPTHAMRKEGDIICRYDGNEDASIDVIIHEDQGWTIRVFTERLEKEIQATSVRNGVPKFMELRGDSYTLKLETITAEPDSAVNAEDME